MSISSSLGGAKSTGSSETTARSGAAVTLAQLAESFAGETKDVRQGLIDAMQEVLSTGGSSIPIISSAVDSSRRASSRALSETEQGLAQSNLAGTPFGENILAEQRAGGERAVASTRESLAQNIFNMISNFALGQSQTALSGLAGAIPGTLNTNENAKATGLDTSVSGTYGFGGKGR